MPIKLLILAVTVNAVVGQLFLKRAMVALGGASALADIPKLILEALKCPWIYTSLAVQAFGYLLWMLLIARVKLGVATASVGAGFYLLMALTAWIFYGETLSNQQWIGIVLITMGVACVSMGTV